MNPISSPSPSLEEETQQQQARSNISSRMDPSVRDDTMTPVPSSDAGDWELTSPQQQHHPQPHPQPPALVPPPPLYSEYRASLPIPQRLPTPPSPPPTPPPLHSHSAFTLPTHVENHFAAQRRLSHEHIEQTPPPPSIMNGGNHNPTGGIPQTSFSLEHHVTTEPSTPPPYEHEPHHGNTRTSSYLEHIRQFDSHHGGHMHHTTTSLTSSAIGDAPSLSQHSQASDTLGLRTPRSRSRSPLEPPPRPMDPTARLLIERERQARLERERARLKQQLALSREREEIDLAFAAVDVARRFAVLAGGNTAASEHGDDSSSNGGVLDIDARVRDIHVPAQTIPKDGGGVLPDAIVVGLLEEQDPVALINPNLVVGGVAGGTTGAAGGMNAERTSQSPLNFTMERFLSDGVTTPATTSPPGEATSSHGGKSIPPIHSGLVDEPNSSNHHHHHHHDSRRSSETSSVLSDLVARDEALDAMVEATASAGPTHTHTHINAIVVPEDDEEERHGFFNGSNLDSTSSMNNLDGGDETVPATRSGGALINIGPDDLPIIEPSSTMDISVENQVSSRNSNHSDLDNHSEPGVDRIISSTSEVSSTHVGREPLIQEDGLPRLAQLTEAEILEMAEIDYASVGNMPPRSVRDEQHLPSYNDLTGLSRASHEFSEVTHTTAQESISISLPSAGIQSGSTEGQDIENHSLDHSLVDDYLSTDSKDLENVMSPGIESNMSVLVNRSELSDGELDDRKPSADDLEIVSSSHGENIKWLHDDNPSSSNDFVNALASKEQDLKVATSESKVSLNSSTESYNLPNRTIRPGMVKMPAKRRDSSRMVHQRSLTTPNIPSFVDGFDYSKYNNNGPFSLKQSSADAAANNASGLDQKLSFTNGSTDIPKVEYHVPVDPNTGSENYGATESFQGNGIRSDSRLLHMDSNGTDFEEARPLISFSANQVARTDRKESIDELVGSVFSSARSLSTEGYDNEFNHSDKYLKSNAFSRAFPERGMTLLVTAFIEIPVFLMIVGRSENLCLILGKSRYQLLMAFLPISMALSGNCGLQASTLSTRGISNEHVTKENYWTWLFTEVKVAAILGITVGSLLGIAAYQASDFDAVFGCTICVANIFSTLISGLLGTFSPLLSTFIFDRDLRKWGGLIQIAIQDIVGCFFMVVISHGLLVYFGPLSIDDDDMC